MQCLPHFKVFFPTQSGKSQCRRVIKLVNETLKLASKNSVMANSNRLTTKQLEKMSVTQPIEFTLKIRENMISGQNESFNEN